MADAIADVRAVPRLAGRAALRRLRQVAPEALDERGAAAGKARARMAHHFELGLVERGLLDCRRGMGAALRQRVRRRRIRLADRHEASLHRGDELGAAADLTVREPLALRASGDEAIERRARPQAV